MMPNREKSGIFLNRNDQNGFSLLELLLAMLLLGMISSMIYSVMNVGIRFSEKGEKRILALERHQAVLSLLHRQIATAWYNPTLKKVMVSSDNNIFKVVTKSPLINRSGGMVLAVYLYDYQDMTLYYTEKKDFFNIDYGVDFQPDPEDMIALLKTTTPVVIDFDEEAVGEGVLVEFDKKLYEFIPRCLDLTVQQP